MSLDLPTTDQVEADPAALDLCREFVEFLISDAACRASAPSLGPTVGWEDIWAQCEHIHPLERALGQAVLIADQVAMQLESAAPPVVAVADHAEPPTGWTSNEDRAPAATTEFAPQVPLVAEPEPVVVPEPFLRPREALDPVTEPVPVVPLEDPAPARIVELAASLPAAALGAEPVAVAGQRPVALRRRLITAATWVRNIGFIVILFAGWQLWGTSIEHVHAQNSLKQAFSAATHRTPSSSSPTLASASATLPAPAEGKVIAHLQIPAIDVDQYVVQGTAEQDLAKGPGHYAGSALPGQQGNVAIAGHRTTYGSPFDRLDQLAVGDAVYVTSDAGLKLTYVVAHAPVAVSPRDVAVLADAGDNRLTLTTCTPRFSATQRLVVVATLHEPLGPATHKRVGLHRLVVGSNGWNLPYLPGSLVAALALMALGFSYRRFRRHLGPVRWLILGPLWVCGVYFLFVALSGLLPATL